MNILNGYHFTSEKLRNGDAIPPVGVWLKYTGPVVPCESGLHMSRDPFDALAYAPGHLLHKVQLRGGLVSHGNPIDKWVGRERKIVASIDATGLLWEFARWNAKQVLHLWDAPQVVKDYLDTGDEKLRAAAEDAAQSAARDAARDAAWDAARSAAWSAAEDAAQSAAQSAAGSAAEDAAWSAAEDAAQSAAWSAAEGAAWSAAWDAAEDAARKEFNRRVREAFRE
jgi:hypothetical protein